MAMTSTPFTSGGAHWIWLPEFNDAAAAAQFVLLRKTFSLDEVPQHHIFLHVSADTRYRLYFNGHSISFGPCKSYPARWNYETVNITRYLVPGLNVLAARVLRFSASHPGCFSMMRTALPGFILECELPVELPGQSIKLNSDTSWKTKRDVSVQFVDESEWDYRLGPSFLNVFESVDGALAPDGYLECDFDDSSWLDAVIVKNTGKMSPMLDPRRLVPREIPLLTEKFGRFDGVVCCSGPASVDEWAAVVRADEALTLSPASTYRVDFEVKALTTGFLDFVCDLNLSSASDTSARPEIEFLCAESYEPAFEAGQPRRKEDRRDFRNGVLYGPVDTYRPRPESYHYSPFWFRTFRYLRLTISTGSNPLVVRKLTYRSTHYPLQVTTTIQTSSPFFRQLWDISLNTLRNCMHETYEDCPYYEQNQFAMDSRSQILFTYLLSRDDRLARKAMQEFYASCRDDGLIEAQYPSSGRCINIPTFSLFWVLMVYDHMVYFGDERLVKTYIGAVDGVLHYFDNRLTDKGLVGKFEPDTWAFVDWADGWFTPGHGFLGVAVPPAYFRTGSATFHSLIYAYTLLKASELCTFLGRHDTAREYMTRQQSVVNAVKQHCYDAESRLFLDGPGASGEFSQHVQALAVLSGCVDSKAAAAELMRKAILRREELCITKASFAMGFYLFRAASAADVYEESWPVLIAPWEKMIEQNLTTWAESEGSVRSDCHAWSATPLYEICREIVGVKQSNRLYLERLGKEGPEIVVTPRKGLVEDIKATVLVGDDGTDTLHARWGKGQDPVVESAQDREIQVIY